MIHLFYFNINKYETTVREKAHSYIQEDDVHKSNLFISDSKRLEFMSSCWVRRFVFERILKIFDYSKTIVRGQYGKPYDSKERIEFNFSTNRSGILCGIRSNGAIGVDIETRRKFTMYALRPFFSAEDIRSIEEEPELFLKLWTRKEAYLKCIGTGWSVKSAVSVGNDEIYSEDKKYRFIDFKLDNDMAASICFEYCNEQEEVSFTEIKDSDLLKVQMIAR